MCWCRKFLSFGKFSFGRSLGFRVAIWGRPVLDGQSTQPILHFLALSPIFSFHFRTHLIECCVAFTIGGPLFVMSRIIGHWFRDFFKESSDHANAILVFIAEGVGFLNASFVVIHIDLVLMILHLEYCWLDFGAVQRYLDYAVADFNWSAAVYKKATILRVFAWLWSGD